MPLAFDLADQYRMTVIILADGILGQMMEPVVLETKPRRELPAKGWALTGAEGREQNMHLLTPSKDRAKIRSKTFPGIARAMAQQWGGLVLTDYQNWLK